MTRASFKREVPLPPVPSWTFEPGILFSEMPTSLFLTRENYFALGLTLFLLVLGASESACDFQATEPRTDLLQDLTEILDGLHG